MAARSKARRRALDLLFAADLGNRPAVEELEERTAAGEGPTNPYTATLVHGVSERREQIDALLRTYAQGWSLERMPAVDRNVLRLGVWELLYAGDVAPHVAISEAMALVRELSTDDSPQFVNGVLGSIERHELSA